MKKKLNLVLRNPVKLHDSNKNAPELPSPYEKFEKREAIQIENEKTEKKRTFGKIESEKIEKPESPVKPKLAAKKEPVKIEIADLRKEMSVRICQIWEYFCKKADADNELRDSFTVTRAEVMREAGIGSTNTYRDALKKMQDLGLIKIELRPGVNAGSVFYLTETGLEQAKLILAKEAR